MKRKKRMQKYIIMFLVASMLLSVGCGETKPEEPVNVIGFGEMDTEGVASWRPENLDMNSDNDNSTVAEIEGVKEEMLTDNAGECSISEEEMCKLVDANYNCVTNIFEVRLDGDEESATENRIPVTDDAFASYAELEAYIRDVYVKEEADHLLYRYSGGVPTYWEADGIFYMRDEFLGGGPCFGCPWESYTIEECTVEDNHCKFTVLAKYPEDIAAENLKEETFSFEATYEDGWKLDSMVCRDEKGSSGHIGGEDSLYIDPMKLISEAEALEIAYDYYYGDSDLEEYRVYCDELPYLEAEYLTFAEEMLGWSYAKATKSGYVVYQDGDETGTKQEKYDPANPSPDKSKWILCSLGATNNCAYYVFWLYQYVPDGDENYHLTTGDFCIVAYDGSLVVSERNDFKGNYMSDPAEWNALEDYLNTKDIDSTAPIITEAEARELVDVNYFCLTELFVYGQLDGEYNTWSEGSVVKVCDDRFTTYADLEKYMDEYFRRHAKEDWLGNAYGQEPMYYEEDDIFYMRLTDTNPGYVSENERIPSFWTGYTVTEIRQSGNLCEIKVVPECEEDLEVTTTYIMRATNINDKWKLEQMGWYACLDEMTVEEGEYSFHLKEKYNRALDSEADWADALQVKIYKNGKLIQIIEEYNELGMPQIEDRIWYVDANFDGRKDLLIYWFYTGAQGAMVYQCYLATEDGFEYCESFDMFNPYVDAENQQIIGTHRGGAGSYERTYYEYAKEAFRLRVKEDYEWNYDLGEYEVTTIRYDTPLYQFLNGEIPAWDTEMDFVSPPVYENSFYVSDRYEDREILGRKWANLDADEDMELIIQGPYGGTYFDARDGGVYVMASGGGTAVMLSYAEYDNKTWLVISDTTHGGRCMYHFYRMDANGSVAEEFELNKLFWENPSEPDGPDTVYECGGEEITKEEYDNILKEIDFYYTEQWYE